MKFRYLLLRSRRKHSKRRAILFLSIASAKNAAASNWLKRTPPHHEQVRNCLDSITGSTIRADEIISGVRELFRKHGDHRTMIHLDDVARQALGLVQQDLLLSEVAVATAFQSDVPKVYADRTLLQQVILNLVRNAIDAMNSAPRGARCLRLETRLNGHSSVLLSVHDTGAGITADDSKLVFEPFFTTKPTGMGLGLSICQTIVQQHGGSLRLAKTDANGCIFEMTLPIIATNDTPIPA